MLADFIVAVIGRLAEVERTSSPTHVPVKALVDFADVLSRWAASSLLRLR